MEEKQVKGYKVFNPDWTCRGFKYEVGKSFEMDEKPKLGKRGFHFCKNLINCFRCYSFNSKNRVAEVIAYGEVEERNDLFCTNKIQIVRKVQWNEVLSIVNIGKWCKGIGNIGNYNKGNYNSGHYNKGAHNSGDNNEGDFNSGDWNQGNFNSGDCNEGNCNSGNYNKGEYNSGDWNKTDYSSGCFNTDEHKIYMFNKPTDWTYNDWLDSEAFLLMNRFEKRCWISRKEMSEEEKEEYPNYKITGGYLKEKSIDELQEVWDNFTDEEKEVIKSLPNFDAEIFKEITGIEV